MDRLNDLEILAAGELLDDSDSENDLAILRAGDLPTVEAQSSDESEGSEVLTDESGT